ncbi:MAG: DoxX family membrane protein [Candidatus Sulfotelmatobacter sp.]
MFTHFVFWLWFAGLTFLIAGLVAVRKELVTARGLDKLIALGPVFVGAPLAVFGAEHFVDARDIMQLVPAWMPAHLFWTYFVGCALLAAATSFVTMKFVRLSATLLGVMFFLFVLMMDLPFAIGHPANRLGWNFVLRESAFAGGAWALAGSLSPESRRGKCMVLIGRFFVALAAIYFGIEQLLHPEFSPGVPDTKLTPAWIPLHALWGYPVGAVLLVAGVALFLNQRPRTAAACIGVLMTLLTLFFYSPIWTVTRDPSQMTDAINFVFDTLLFGGTALLVARALPAE